MEQLSELFSTRPNKKAAFPDFSLICEPFSASLKAAGEGSAGSASRLSLSCCLGNEPFFMPLLHLGGTTEQFAVYLYLPGLSFSSRLNYISIIRSLQIHLT